MIQDRQTYGSRRPVVRIRLAVGVIFIINVELLIVPNHTNNQLYLNVDIHSKYNNKISSTYKKNGTEITLNYVKSKLSGILATDNLEVE